MTETINVPDFLPFLRSGVGETPQDGGCLVQVAGFLYDGHSWSDDVTCVHPVLRSAGIRVNDSVGDEARKRLALSAARIAGSNDALEGWSDQDKKVLNVRLAVWAARQVLHLAKDQEKATAAIEAAEAWANDPSDKNKTAAYAAAHAADATYATYAAYAAAGYAAYAAAAYAYAAAAYAAAGYAFAAYAAADIAKVELYEGLVDEFDRLTGRTSEPMTPEQGEAIRNLSDAMVGAR